MWCVNLTLPYILSDEWCGAAGPWRVHDVVPADDRTHHKITPQLVPVQHAADQWHYHHLHILPGISGRSEGEPLSPSDGMTQTAPGGSEGLCCSSSCSAYFSCSAIQESISGNFDIICILLP